MDGLFIDNTAISYGLSALQSDSGLENNFQISAFINTTNQLSDWVNITLNDDGILKLPYDITMLFGFDQDGNPLPTNDGYPIPVSLSHSRNRMRLFSIVTLTGIPADPNWSFESSDSNVRLEQRTIKVTTRDNETFGIPGK